MGFKKKIFGIVAAAALTFTMAGAASAQTEVDGRVELDGGSCGVAVTEGDFDLGNVTWTGERWAYAPGANSSRITVDITSGWSAPGSTGQCQITVDTEDGLSNGTNTINRLYFQSGAQQGIQLFPAQTLAATFNLNEGEADLTMGISHPLPARYTPGEYTGTFVLTVEDGQ